MKSSKQIADMIASAVVANATMLTPSRINELGGVSFELFDSVSGETYTISVQRGRRSR